MDSKQKIQIRIRSARVLQWLSDIWYVFTEELRRMLHDPGVLTIFVVASLAYPLLYKTMYYNEQVLNIPVAVVDMDASPESRHFLHKWNATPDVEIAYTCENMAQAEELMRHGKIHGILYIPSDYSHDIATVHDQATLSLYCDMSSFLYMKGVYMSCNKVMLDEMHNIQLNRFERMGFGPQTSWVLTQGAPYTETALYCPNQGYGSFIIPPVLLLIIHQTLLLGICMMAGTAYEERRTLYTLPGSKRRRGSFRIVFGKGAAYFLLYYLLAIVVLVLYPKILNIPNIGHPLDIIRFLVPFLMATIFFSMTISLFIHNRETGMVILVTTSLMFLFISGISWPIDSIPMFWQVVGAFIPSTCGIHGFVRMNTMGATIYQVEEEYIALWALTCIYFITATAGLYLQGLHADRGHRPEFKNKILHYFLD